MKKLWKRLTAALLSVVLLLGAAGVIGMAGAAGSTANVYLMAVNDVVHEMTADNMPMLVNGVLYVPYTMLSPRISGINLGVSAQYSATRGTVLVSGGQRAVTFDTRASNAYDLQGVGVSARAMVRNAMVYLPIDWLCTYFESISYTTTRTRYGTLVRVTSSSVILNDAAFVDAADNQLRDNLRRYQDSIAVSEPPVESTPPTPTPTVAPTAPPVREQPVVYLAFRWGERTEDAARQLENRGLRALFLLTPEQIAGQDDLVRRLVGAGHTVGLNLTGETPEDCLAQAEEGRRLLAEVARCAPSIVCADGLDQAGRQELTGAGYALWQPTSRGEDARSAEDLLRRLTAARPNYVDVTCDATGLSLMTAALRTLSGEDYRLRQALAPALQAQ